MVVFAPVHPAATEAEELDDMGPGVQVTGTPQTTPATGQMLPQPHNGGCVGVRDVGCTCNSFLHPICIKSEAYVGAAEPYPGHGFEVGMEVMLQGLVKRPDLNSVVVMVVSLAAARHFDASALHHDGRIAVHHRDGSKLGNIYMILPINLGRPSGRPPQRAPTGGDSSDVELTLVVQGRKVTGLGPDLTWK